MNENPDYLAFASLDRRMIDDNNKLMNLTGQVAELTRQIIALDSRVNNGVSPKANKAELDCSVLDKKVESLDHKVEISIRDMTRTVTETAELTRSMLSNFRKGDLEPVTAELSWIKKTFIYGTVAGLASFATFKGATAIWDAFVSKPAIVAPFADTSQAKRK